MPTASKLETLGRYLGQMERPRERCRKLVIRQKGGLGNQMFQYAAGLVLAQSANLRLHIATTPTTESFSHGCPRDFLLDRFAISCSYGDLTISDRLVLSGRNSLGSLQHLYKGRRKIQRLSEAYRDRYTFSGIPVISDSADLIYLEGYWQVHQFAALTETRIRAEFVLKQAASPRNQQVLHRINGSSQSVSVHVRRGDYATLFPTRVLPASYYRKAIGMARDLILKPRFFVFSDDMDFAREVIQASEDIVFASSNDQYHAHEELRLMSSCSHNIIANSTFSWWGAWLNTNQAKVVIAPSSWLEPGIPHPDILPPSWTTVSCAS